jgi:predicted permease
MAAAGLLSLFSFSPFRLFAFSPSVTTESFMPEWKQIISERLARLKLEPTREAEIIDEIAQHLEDRYQELRAGGATRAVATRTTLAELSDSRLLARELQRAERTIRYEPVVLGAGRKNVMADLWQDLRYGLCILRKNPLFTIVAAFSLALGIGANTAIFSLINAVMLKPLPVKDPQQLALFSVIRQGRPQYSFNYLLFKRLCENTRSFAGIAAARAPERMRLTASDVDTTSTEMIQAVKVSGNFFSVLGVDATLGRALSEDDDQASNPQPVVVLNHEFWQRKFGSDTEIIGKKITLNDYPFTVVGVAPPGFFGFEVGRKPDLWYPIQMLSVLNPTAPDLRDSGAWTIRVIGRLQPEADRALARDEADTVLKQQVEEVIAERPKMLEGDRKMFHAMRVELEPGSAGWTSLRQQFKQPLLILLAITGLVLLIACANVANLLLARAAARQKEIAVRLALGAGRARIVRQLLTEGVLLACAGGALGLLLAQWGTRALLVYMPSPLTTGLQLSPDGRILGFALAVSVLTGVLFSLAPTLQTTRLDLIASLKNQAGSQANRPRLALNKILVVAQVALSLVLLIGAGLLVRSLQNLHNIDAGFDRENLLQFAIEFGKGYSATQRVNTYKEVLARLERLPGARSATLANFSLLSGNRIFNKIVVPGYAPPTEDDAVCNALYVGPNYFETMGMRLLAGRDFSPQDERPPTPSGDAQSSANAAKHATADAPLYAVINQSMAKQFFAGDNPLGKRFSYQGGGPKDRVFEVIGVVNDTKYLDLREAMPKTFFVSFFQQPGSAYMGVQLRTTGNPAALAVPIQRLVQELDPSLQATEMTTMSNVVDDSIREERFIAQMAGFFSLFALLLACIGLYGVMSYAVTRRTNELGIRMALGAQGRDVIKLVMRETMRLVGLGILIGLGAALAASRLIASLLYGLTATDPLTIALAVVVMIGVAALAGYLPARRASQVDPMVALRYE